MGEKRKTGQRNHPCLRFVDLNWERRNGFTKKTRLHLRRIHNFLCTIRSNAATFKQATFQTANSTNDSTMHDLNERAGGQVYEADQEMRL